MIDDKEIDAVKILSLLNITFKGNNNTTINNAVKELNQITQKNINKYLKFFFNLLSLNSINNFEISLELHLSIILYLKTIFSYQNKELDSYIFDYTKEFIILLITNKKNINLNEYILFNNCMNLIENLLYSNSFRTNYNYIKELFILLYKYISLNEYKTDIEINTRIALLNNIFIKSKTVNKENFISIFNEYYLLVMNQIQSNIETIETLLFNQIQIKFIQRIIYLIKYVFKGLYDSIKKMKLIINQKQREEISFFLLNKYGKFSLHIIQYLCKIFKKNNSIILVNEEYSEEITNAINSIFKFINIILNILYEKTEKKLEITNNVIITIISELIKSIIKSFENLLYDKDKFYKIRSIKNEINKEKIYIYKYLNNITLFLKITLFIEPFKTEFSSFNFVFLFNVLFPLLISLDEEKYFMEEYPEQYLVYFNEIITKDDKALNLNFRGFICSLIVKIFNDIELNSQNKILMIIFNTFKNTINKELGKNYKINIDEALPENQKILINELDSEIKIDLCLLIFIILKNSLKNNINYINNLITYLALNQEKIQSIKSKLILMKLCILYKDILPFTFYCFKKQNNKETIFYESFINKAICFLLNNIMESKVVCNISIKAIIELINSLKLIDNNFSRELILFKDAFNSSLNINFKSFIQVFSFKNIDIPFEFYELIEKLLENIIIKDKNSIAILLNNLANEMTLKIKNSLIKDNLFEYYEQILNIFIKFLEGINKSINSNEEEKFRTIFNNVLLNINESFTELFFDKLIKIAYLYIKFIGRINLSIIIFMKKVLLKIENESIITTINYNFIFIFILNIDKAQISKEEINEIFPYIIDLIIKSYSFTNNSINFTLLLTFQLFTEYKTYNLNNKQIKLLINNVYENYYVINDDYLFHISDLINNILIISIISLSFIIYPGTTYRILNEFKETKNTKFEKYILMLKIFNGNIHNESYFHEIYFYLRIIEFIGLYSIIKNLIFKNVIENEKDKIKIFEAFILLFSERKEGNLINCKENDNNILKEITNDENEFINEVNINIKNILDKNCLINNINEKYLYSEIIEYIRINEIELFHKIKFS